MPFIRLTEMSLRPLLMAESHNCDTFVYFWRISEILLEHSSNHLALEFMQKALAHEMWRVYMLEEDESLIEVDVTQSESSTIYNRSFERQAGGREEGNESGSSRTPNDRGDRIFGRSSPSFFQQEEIDMLYPGFISYVSRHSYQPSNLCEDFCRKMILFVSCFPDHRGEEEEMILTRSRPLLFRAMMIIPVEFLAEFLATMENRFSFETTSFMLCPALSHDEYPYLSKRARHLLEWMLAHKDGSSLSFILSHILPLIDEPCFLARIADECLLVSGGSGLLEFERALRSHPRDIYDTEIINLCRKALENRHMQVASIIVRKAFKYTQSLPLLGSFRSVYQEVFDACSSERLWEFAIECVLASLKDHVRSTVAVLITEGRKHDAFKIIASNLASDSASKGRGPSVGWSGWLDLLKAGIRKKNFPPTILEEVLSCDALVDELLIQSRGEDNPLNLYITKCFDLVVTNGDVALSSCLRALEVYMEKNGDITDASLLKTFTAFLAKVGLTPEHAIEALRRRLAKRQPG